MSRQSMSKNHIFIQNHKVPFLKQAIFNSFQNQSKHANFSLFFEINQNIPKSTSSLFNSHVDTFSNSNTFTYHILFLMPNFNNTISNQPSLYIINIVLTITWLYPQINLNHSSSIYHDKHISNASSYHQGINNHNHIYDHIIYLNQNQIYLIYIIAPKFTKSHTSTPQTLLFNNQPNHSYIHYLKFIQSLVSSYNAHINLPFSPFFGLRPKIHGLRPNIII